MPKGESIIYKLILTKLLQALSTDRVEDHTEVILKVGDSEFKSKGKVIVEEGFKEIELMMNNLVEMYSHISEENKNKFNNDRESLGQCPRCKSDVFEGKKDYYCSNKECSFSLFKEDSFFVEGKKKLTKDMVKSLLIYGEVKIRGLYSRRKEKIYDAYISIDDTGKYINYKIRF